MKSTPPTPPPITLSLALYRLLLAAYPSEFRQAFGADMLQLFGDVCRRDFRAGGPSGLLACWARTMLDFLQSVVEEHARRGVNMTRTTFLKISAAALIVGPFVFLLGLLAGSRPTYSPYNAASLPIDRIANASVGILISIALVLISLGVVGLLARYGAQTGGVGRAGLGLAAVSAPVSALGIISLSIFDFEPWWSVFFLGATTLFLGLALFGIACWSHKPLPSWNALPAISFIWLPGWLLSGVVFELITGNWLELPDPLEVILIVVSAAGLAVLGVQLLKAAGDPQGALQAG